VLRTLLPQVIAEPETKFVPFTVNRNPALPAGVEFGLRDVIEGDWEVTVKVAVPDVAPPGFITVMLVSLALATKLGGTTAVNCVVLTLVVVSELPPHFTIEPETKCAPFTVSVKPALPLATEAGDNVEMEGDAGAFVAQFKKRL
jgi:hypothetical protein